MSQAHESAARNAGRGGLAVLGAQVFFVISGLVQQTVLPRVIGLAGYGALARVLALANIPNNVIVASSTQGVSRAVARARGAEGQAFRGTLKVHVPLAVGVAALFAALAPWLAAFEGAPHIVRPLILTALVLFFYGIYAPVIGLLNGRAQFTRQAALDVAFAVLRTTGLIGVGWIVVRKGGSGVLGSALGFVLAAACIVPIAARLARIPAPPGDGRASAPPVHVHDERPRDYLAQLAPLAAAQFFTSAVMQVDITLLGHFLSTGAAGDLKAADEWVAVYRACQLFAFLPYQLLLSITQILFPMLARAKAEGDLEGVRRYVERGGRLAAVACGMMVSVIVAIPRPLLSFAYSPDVARRGEGALRILALGQGAYTMLAIATTVLASLGQERLSAAITFATLVAVTAACTVLTGGAAFGGGQLAATAAGTSIGLFAGLIVAGVFVRKEAGGFVPGRSAVRVGIALAMAGVVGSFLPTEHGRLLTPVLACVVAATFLLILCVTRELTRADLTAIRSLRGA
jgi:stage V sporulation protein B